MLEVICTSCLAKDEGMQFWACDRWKFELATDCYFYHKRFEDSPEMEKMRDHQQLTGCVRDLPHSNCNIQTRKITKIPVFSQHSGYDSHLIVSLKKFRSA